jgi:hypothetical protein
VEPIPKNDDEDYDGDNGTQMCTGADLSKEVEVKRGEGKDPEKLRGLKYIIHIHMKTAQ